MFLTKVISKARGLLSPSAIEKKLIYLLIAAVPFMIYPISINGATIDRRTIREVSFFSFAILISTFLQKNRWMRYLVIWCVINWWLNYFPTLANYTGLVDVFSAMVIFIGIKDLMDRKISKDEYIKELLRLHGEYSEAGFNLAIHGLKNSARFFDQVQLKENGGLLVVDKVVKKYPWTGMIYSFGGSVAKEREKKIQEPEEKVMDEKSVDKNSYRAIEDNF